MRDHLCWAYGNDVRLYLLELGKGCGIKFVGLMGLIILNLLDLEK